MTKPTQAEGVYQIGSAAELAWFAQQTESETGLKGQLTANINLNGKPWTGIKQFAGTLDGGGHVVSGVTAPLFDSVDANGTVKNLVVMGSITGSGHLGGIVSTLSGTVENCAFEGSVTNTAPPMVLSVWAPSPAERRKAAHPRLRCFGGAEKQYHVV